MADEPFFSRWSKRKSEARSGVVAPEPAPPPSVPPIAPAAADGARAPLPAVESLTGDSDFAGFMQPEVEEALRRRALKTLFNDPRFNLMDGLDVYIDDFSKPDPLPESWLSQLNQMSRLGAYEEPVEAPEKPSDEQGLAGSPSSDTSDTADGGAGTPAVPE